MKTSSHNSASILSTFSNKVISILIIILFLGTLSSFVSIQKREDNKSADRIINHEKIGRSDIDKNQYKFMNNVTFQLGDDCFDEGTVMIVDENFLRNHKIKFIIGDPKIAFKDPHSVIITERIANLVFSGMTPEFQIIRCGHNNVDCELKITGIIEDISTLTGANTEYLVSTSLYQDLHASSK